MKSSLFSVFCCLLSLSCAQRTTDPATFSPNGYAECACSSSAAGKETDLNKKEYTCTLGRSALRERIEAWGNLFHRRLSRQAIVRGFAYRFPEEMKAEVKQLIALEKKCCSFLEFKLAGARDEKEKNTFWLQITTPEGGSEPSGYLILGLLENMETK